jgi:hypothetical protein
MRLETILQLYVARAAGVAAGLAQATGTASPKEADAVAGGMLGLTNDRAETKVACRGDRETVRRIVAKVLAASGEPLEDRDDLARLVALLPGPSHGRLSPSVAEVILEPAEGNPTGLVVVAVAKRLPAGVDQAALTVRDLAARLAAALGGG